MVIDSVPNILPPVQSQESIRAAGYSSIEHCCCAERKCTSTNGSLSSGVELQRASGSSSAYDSEEQLEEEESPSSSIKLERFYSLPNHTMQCFQVRQHFFPRLLLIGDCI